MKTFDVPLTHWEMTQAVYLGLMRMSASESQGLDHANATRRPFRIRMEDEFLGACGELALAKLTRRYLTPTVNTFHGPVRDLGAWEIRATKHRNGRLIIRPEEDPDRPYLLIVGEPPHLTVVGWTWGRDGMLREYLDNPPRKDGGTADRPSYFVPQHVLTELKPGDPT